MTAVTSAVRRHQAVRIIWGAACVLGAARGARAVRDAHAERIAIVLRLLGARHIVQGAVLLARPDPMPLAAGAVVDLLHAASMAGLGWLDRPRRRPALTDAAVALSWSARSAADARATARQRVIAA